jgi:cytochrome P450
MADILPQGGEGHQRRRRMISGRFTAKRVSALRPGIMAMAEQLVDEMVAVGGLREVPVRW